MTHLVTHIIDRTDNSVKFFAEIEEDQFPGITLLKQKISDAGYVELVTEVTETRCSISATFPTEYHMWASKNVISNLYPSYYNIRADYNEKNNQNGVLTPKSAKTFIPDPATVEESKNQINTLTQALLELVQA